MGVTLQAPNRGFLEYSVDEKHYGSPELALNDMFSQLVLNISQGKGT
jgi:hypothetical protein